MHRHWHVALSFSDLGRSASVEVVSSKVVHLGSFSSYVNLSKHGSVTMASKRLIKELDAYNCDRPHAVASLEPVSDDDLFHLRAVLRGPEGTAYEGT